MKKLFWILLIIGLFVAGYFNRTVLAEQTNHLAYHSQCDTPIGYHIGSIDQRFNITQEQLTTDLQEAADVWNTARGKKLFVADPNGPLAVSLIYDERQSLNTQINNLDDNLKQQNEQLKPEIAEYNRRVVIFKQKNAALNDEIDSWNNKGGAPPEEYQKLLQRQESLQQESNALQAEAQSLGQSTEEYNSQVKELNQTVNTFNQALRFKPEEGLYIEDQKGRRINIYFNNSKKETIHTLAHEFGHAIGLAHTPDTSAIMFSQTNNVIIPSSNDLAALEEICRKKSIIEIAKEKIQYLRTHIKIRDFSATFNTTH